MSHLTPLVQQSEKAKLKDEITGREVSVVFDGTTCLREAMAVVLRLMSGQGQKQQRLVRLMVLSKSITGKEKDGSLWMSWS